MSIFDKIEHNINILRKLQLPRPHYLYMIYEKRKMEEAGAKYFLKALKEGDYFYHVTGYGAVKEIIASGRIKADRHRRGTVSFTTNPLRYLGPFTGFYPINDAYIKIPMEKVPTAFPVVYWLTSYEARELSDELKKYLISMENFESLFLEYGLAWPAYIYPFIWAYENEWRVMGDFHLPWEYVTIGVSNPQQKRALEDYWIALEGKVFVDERLSKIFRKR